MRAVIDHHVDRPDVDAQQCVKLTGTNRSIGLIYIMPIARSDKRIRAATAKHNQQTSFTRSNSDPLGRRPEHRSRSGEGPSIAQVFCFDDLVVIARGNTPDPIPNSAVKTLSVDGTPS